MIISKKLKKVWIKGKNQHGITTVAKEAKVDSRTILRAIKGGECHKDSFDRINEALLKLNEELKANNTVQKLLASYDDGN